MTREHIVSVGAIAPELQLVQGLPDAALGEERLASRDETGATDHEYGAASTGPIVTLKEQRALGRVVLYFMRAFH